MAFCSKCGAEGSGQFCARCGSALALASPGVVASGLQDNVAGALCYALWLITGIIFLVIEPYSRNKFVRFHAFQSIFTSAALWILSMFLMWFAFLLPVGPREMMFWLGSIVRLGMLALWVILMIKAWQGERFKLPLVGDLAERQA